MRACCVWLIVDAIFAPIFKIAQPPLQYSDLFFLGKPSFLCESILSENSSCWKKFVCPNFVSWLVDRLATAPVNSLLDFYGPLQCAANRHELLQFAEEECQCP